MSSHHFVKEGQEMPLIVLSWSRKLAEVAGQLLGWQPLFIVKENYLDHVLSHDLKPDVILTKEKQSNYAFLQPVEFWQEILRERGEQYMVLCSWDKETCVEWVLSTNDVLYTETHKYYKLNSSDLKIWLPFKSTIEIYDVQTDEFNVFLSEKEGFFEKKMGDQGFVMIEEL